jgi:hypothetical protein
MVFESADGTRAEVQASLSASLISMSTGGRDPAMSWGWGATGPRRSFRGQNGPTDNAFF